MNSSFIKKFIYFLVCLVKFIVFILCLTAMASLKYDAYETQKLTKVIKKQIRFQF